MTERCTPDCGCPEVVLTVGKERSVELRCKKAPPYTVKTSKGEVIDLRVSGGVSVEQWGR